MKSISMKLATLLVKNNKALHEKVDYIRYGIEVMLMSLIGVAGMIVISLLVGDIYSWIPFLISFALLRSCAGGYHAKNARSCLVISEALFGVALLVSVNIDFKNEVYIFSYILCFVIVLLFSPVESEKKKLSSDLKYKNRLKSLICMLVNLIVILSVKNAMVKELYYMGMLIAVLSMFFAIIIERRKNHEKSYS